MCSGGGSPHCAPCTASTGKHFRLIPPLMFPRRGHGPDGETYFLGWPRRGNISDFLEAKVPRGPDGETFSGFHPDGETCCWWHSRQEEEGNSAASSRQVVTPTGKHIGGFPPECFPVGVTLYGTVVHPDGETSRKLDGETFAQRGNMSSTGKHMQQMFPRRGQKFGPDGETFEHVSPSSLSAPPRRGNICSTGKHFGPRPRRGNIW